MLQAHTDRGLVRETDEDAAFAEQLPGGVAVLVVADGVGGYPGGEIASATAVAAVAAVLRTSGLDDPGQALAVAFAEANRRVRAAQQGAYAQMSTTLVAALVREGSAWVANVGDSRGYLVSEGEARPLTLDHSWAAEAIRAGRLAEGDPAAILNRHLITRSVGSERELAVDVYGPIALPPGSVLLLCTDGLHNIVDDLQIAEIVGASSGDYAADLLAEALGRGAPDNVAVALFAQPPSDGRA